MAIYLLAWGVEALVLASLLRLQGDLDFKQALQVSVPLALLYAFLCLTPWYGCRTLPLSKTSNVKIALNHLGAAVFATALWLGAARLIGLLLDLDRKTLELPLLIAVGFFLYGLSIALHYTWLAKCVFISRASCVRRSAWANAKASLGEKNCNWHARI